MTEQTTPNPENLAFYHWLAARFPEGLTGAENVIPVTVDEYDMGAIIFEPLDKEVSFGLFLPNHRYSRKTILIDSLGQVTEDTVGVIPNFDRATNEPIFTSSNEEIVGVVSRAIQGHFTDQPQQSL